MTAALTQPLAITAMGALSAAGATAAETFGSTRAGVAGFSEHPFFESLSSDPEWVPGEPLLAASCPELGAGVEGAARLMTLALPALQELGQQARLRRDDLRRSALLLALPVRDSIASGWALEDQFVPELCRLTGMTEFRCSETFRSGHTGMFEATARAHALLSAGECEHCFVVGVDSYLSPRRLEEWDRTWRLRSERNADGFIPGEAATALLIELPAAAQRRGAALLSTIEALSLGREAQPLDGPEASSGAGLCQVLREVVPPGQSARWVCCDMNGESYRAFEWGLAQVRLAGALAGMQVLDHPADCLGDVGAASGGVLMGHVTARYNRPAPPTDDAVLWASADDGTRAAMRLSAPEHQPQQR